MLNSDLNKHLFKTLCDFDYAIPLYWGTQDKNGRFKIGNSATAFMLDCGKEPFVVTAAHVYEEYIEKIKQSENIISRLHNVDFPLEERVIQHIPSKKLDIITFRIQNHEIRRLNKNIISGNKSKWPPDIPSTGKTAFFAGFPGQSQMKIQNAAISFSYYAALLKISSVSSKKIGCSLEKSRLIDVCDNGLPVRENNLGGLSGSPILIIDESDEGIFTWHLGGVIYTASSKLGVILLAFHAKFIRADGTLSVDI